jgi:hypothetical protein
MVSFKLTQLFLVTLLSIIVFGFSYMYFFQLNVEEAMFMSLRVQTLSGSYVVAKTRQQKLLLSIQSLIAYLVTSGMIVAKDWTSISIPTPTILP